MVSCKSNEERKIEYVKPVDECRTPTDSLMRELETLMEDYSAALAQSEEGEDVTQRLHAIQAKVGDFSLKMEMVLHDMTPEDMERFNKFYEECLDRLGLNAPRDSSSIDVAY